MAFENVTYTFYSTTLGRSVIPSDAVFQKYKLENVQYMKSIQAFLSEKEENGIDSAVCMMMEVDYSESPLSDQQTKKSESLDGYSYSLDSTAKNLAEEKNFKTTDQKKRYWIDLFCNYYGGIK